MRLPANACIALACVLISPRLSPAQTRPAPTPPAPATPAQTAPAQTPPAQAAPPAPAAAEARPDFSGTWTLDRNISHDPSKATFDPAQGRGNQRPGGFGGGSRRGRGGLGGGSRRDDSAPSNDRTPDERTRLQALTDQLRTASARLVISHHDPSFVINDALDHTQFFQTDDSANDHQVGQTTVASTTHWEGPRLVTEYTLSSRLKLTSTYTLLAATKQMVIRVRLDDTERRRAIGSELKLVYTLGPPASQ